MLWLPFAGSSRVLPGHPCGPRWACCPLSPGPLAPSSLLTPSGVFSVVHWLSPCFSVWLVGHLCLSPPWFPLSLSPHLNVYPPLCVSVFLFGYLYIHLHFSISLCLPVCLSVWISMHTHVPYGCASCPSSFPVSLLPPSASLLLPDSGWCLSCRPTLPSAAPTRVSSESSAASGPCSCFPWGQKSGCPNIWLPPGDSGSGGRTMGWLARGLPCPWGATGT